MRRKITALLVTLMMTLGLLVASQSTAQAVWGCRSWAEWPVYGHARCDGGLGGVRVWVQCYYGEVFPGPWRTAGQTSTAICQGYIVKHWYETWQG